MSETLIITTCTTTSSHTYAAITIIVIFSFESVEGTPPLIVLSIERFQVYCSMNTHLLQLRCPIAHLIGHALFLLTHWWHLLLLLLLRIFHQIITKHAAAATIRAEYIVKRVVPHLTARILILVLVVHFRPFIRWSSSILRLLVNGTTTILESTGWC